VSEDRLFEKLDGIEGQNRDLLVALTRLEEQIKEVPDLRIRLRALEQWRWMVVGALVAGGGSLGAQVLSAFRGGV